MRRIVVDGLRLGGFDETPDGSILTYAFAPIGCDEKLHSILDQQLEMRADGCPCCGSKGGWGDDEIWHACEECHGRLCKECARPNHEPCLCDPEEQARVRAMFDAIVDTQRVPEAAA